MLQKITFKNFFLLYVLNILFECVFLKISVGKNVTYLKNQSFLIYVSLLIDDFFGNSEGRGQ